ncbi:methyltransferase domain-containing protein [Microbacterium sp. gxy059]|uniref:methyltransferase domain-containing protein n=1 Tax=Microbacterium sp. gxy059 TaxID=2957199 RepID=UPI003D96C342
MTARPFSSTASFYARHRPGIPDEVAALVAAAAPAGSPRRLLDAGTGTGLVIRALAGFFDEAIGVDVDADLLAEAASALAPEISAGAVELRESPAEDIRLPESRRVHLVTVCRAFHWFDRPRFLAAAADALVDDGALAVFGDRSIWAYDTGWKAEVVAVIRDMLGDRRRAGGGAYVEPSRDFADDIGDAGFRGIQRRVVPVRRVRSIDDVIGELHSTSFVSPAVLGDRAEAFDARVRERLVPIADERGLLLDDNAFEIITALRPRR